MILPAMAHHFAFDLGGRLTDASDPAATYECEYDRLDRLVGAELDVAGLNPNVFFELAYDKSSNRTKLAVDVGNLEDFVNDYAYDDLNRLQTVTQQAQADNAVAEKRADFTYNLAGQFDTITRRAGLLTTSPTVATTSYDYDLAGRLTGIVHASGSNLLIGHGYAYDQANRITEYNYLRSGGGLSNTSRTATFDYDARDQLIEDDRSGTSNDRTFVYDQNGNRETVNGAAWTTGPNNQLVDDGTFTYTYDDEGNRITRTRISSASSSTYLAEYSYDHRNRLTKVTFKDNSSAITETLDYIYDAFDRLVRRTHDADGAGSGTATDTFYIWDGHDSVLEFDDNGSSDISRRSLYGPAVDMLLAEEHVDSTSSPGEVYWTTTDHQGSVRDVLTYDAGTSTTTIANSIDYDGFGRRLSQTNSAVQVRAGYAGYFRDETTGWYLTQTRWYDPATGKWTTEDWIGFAGLDPNLARYVGNSVTYTTDPSGLADWWNDEWSDWLSLTSWIGWASYESDRTTCGAIYFNNQQASQEGNARRERNADWMQQVMDPCVPEAPVEESSGVPEFSDDSINAMTQAAEASVSHTAGGGGLTNIGARAGRGGRVAAGAGDEVGEAASDGATATPAAPRGGANPAVQKAASRGSTLHCDKPGHLPEQLRERYPETQFEFAKPGQQGQDVRVTGGKHPSEYDGSAWPKGTDYADFKPDTASGNRTFQSDQWNKWSDPTHQLPYDPQSGKLK